MSHTWKPVGFAPVFECSTCGARVLSETTPDKDMPVTYRPQVGAFGEPRPDEESISCATAALLRDVALS